MKKLCLFAGYHKNGVIAEYVIYYVKKMAELADVYYMADCEMLPGELNKLTPYVKAAWAYRHKKYDFGSWQEMINKLGWDKISQYDELILCNDSCFGPLFDLKPLFDKASADAKCDFWGLSKGYDEVSRTWHLHSFFWVFKKKVFTYALFESFISDIKEETSYIDLIHAYEFALTPMLIKRGFKAKTAFNLQDKIGHYWRKYIKNGYPFIKIKIFTKFAFEKNTDSLAYWQKFLKKYSSYPVSLIEKHLNAVGVRSSALYYCFSFYAIKKFLRKLRHLLFYKNKKHGNNILRILGFYIKNTNKDLDVFLYEDNSIPLL